ncbi:MAG: ABC transporter permease [Gammaproteobacteria bacterium]|nr:ABC transporter permease [Gammaproteobacteria bacterium]
MNLSETLRFASGTIQSYRMRSFLTAIGIAVGITTVVLLTSIGEGVHRFVVAEFTQFGTNLIGINPGKSETHGVSIGVFGSTKPLTLEDSEALKRIQYVEGVVPMIQGNVDIEVGSLGRRTTVYGVGPEFPEVLKFNVRSGRFLPKDNIQSPRAFAVLGSKLRRELFGNRTALGERIRIGGYRYRVIGVMEPKGQILGFDIDDAVYIPTARAQELLDQEGLFEIDILYSSNANVDNIVAAIKRTLINRHGKEDFTVTTQQQMLDVLGSVLNVLTFVVAALGAISLIVGGIGILTIMTIAVNERTPEIGLLKSLGARSQQIMTLFLVEAGTLGILGGILGLGLGLGIAYLLSVFLPALPIQISWPYAIAAEVLALTVGIIAGIVPAMHAAKMEAVEALRAE